MRQDIFKRFTFHIDETDNNFYIYDNFERLSDIVVRKHYQDASLIAQVSDDVIILYLPYADGQKVSFGDIYAFDAKNHAFSLIAENCSTQISINLAEHKYVLMTGKDPDKKPLYMYATSDGRVGCTQDKKHYNTQTKNHISTTDIMTFRNGAILQRIVSQNPLGYTKLAMDLYNPETNIRHRICIADKIDIRQGDDGCRIYFEDRERGGRSLITPDGVPFTICKPKETDEGENKKVIYSNYYYALIEEQVEVGKDDIITNLYTLNFDDCTEQEKIDIAEGMYEDPDHANELILKNQNHILLANNLTDSPKLTLVEDGSVTLKYSTESAKCITKISEEGYPTTFKVDHTPVC